MLFLSPTESVKWRSLARRIENSEITPASSEGLVRRNLLPAFFFYAGTRLAVCGRMGEAVEWLEAGALHEDEELLSSTYLLGFLERQKSFTIPAPPFEDPRPFLHFAGVPVMKEARARFVSQAVRSLPELHHPVRLMDIGCGNGALTVDLLSALLESRRTGEIGEVLLIDSSPAMVVLATRALEEAFPGTPVTALEGRIQDFSGRIPGSYDIALSSLAFHHMPAEEKRVHLACLKPQIDHFLLFELDADNDFPEQCSPELALSVYQSYGRIIEFVFSHDAPVEVAVPCIDLFLMSELISILTRPRGIRSDYHMRKIQWDMLFQEILGPEFTLQCDSSCYADEYITLFAMHYGRGG